MAPSSIVTSLLLAGAALQEPSVVLAFHGLPRHLGQLDAERQSTEVGVKTDAAASFPGLHRCLWGPESAGKNSDRAQAVWGLAFEESGLAAENVSDYGCHVPKLPYAWVEEIQAMNHTKIHNYNFQGGHQWSLDLQEDGFHWPQFEARNWALEFAKANFTDDDYLKLTDIDEDYKPMGAFDHSSLDSFDSRGAHGLDGMEHSEYMETFDESFFQHMASSNFTLCPGGDMPWSMRFYEAIAAGSIPIIGKPMYDMSAPHLWALWEIPYKFYLLDSGDEFVYRQDWVDYNFDLLVKYQTFHEGDLRPSTAEAAVAYRPR